MQKNIWLVVMLVMISGIILGSTINPQICSADTIQFTNPLTASNISTFAQKITNGIRGVVVVLAILFITIGGVMYVTSAGNPAMATMAKNAITGALIGLAIVVAAPSMLREVYSAMGGASSGVSVNVTELNQAPDLKTIATNVLNFLLSVVGILGMIGLVIGSIMYLTSMGNQKQVDTGKAIIKYSLIGVAVAFASLVMVKQIQVLLAA